jgi:hypothetical protein
LIDLAIAWQTHTGIVNTLGIGSDLKKQASYFWLFLNFRTFKIESSLKQSARNTDGRKSLAN